MGDVVLLALLAAANPTLLAVTTVMLLLPHPERLMLGYWFGAMFTSVTLGLVIVFALEGSSVVGTTKRTLSPVADFVLAGIMLTCAALLLRSRGNREQPREKKGAKKRRQTDQPPKWQQAIGKGNAKTSFVIGALLTLPGATYLAGLTAISKQHYATAVTVVIVIAFNLVQLLLIEIPILAFKIAPTETPIRIEQAKEWARMHGREYGAWGLVVLGAALVAKGLIELI